jgi:defect in organelle trafficking protein DotD
MRKFLVFFSALLVGCSTCNQRTCNKPADPTSITPPINNRPDDATVQLAEAAAAVSASLNQLKAIEKASHPFINSKYLSDPTCVASSSLKELMSVDWSGPIEPLLKRIARVANYKLHVIGRRPGTAVLVLITARNTPIYSILRDANLQAGSKANIIVYPSIRVIELRYGRI